MIINPIAVINDKGDVVLVYINSIGGLNKYGKRRIVLYTPGISNSGIMMGKGLDYFKR